MPPVAWESPAAQAKSGLGLAYIRTIAWFGEVLPTVAIVTAALGMIRLGLIIIGAYVQRRRARRRKLSPWHPAGIAVLGPAYNKETVICKTIQTCFHPQSEKLCPLSGPFGRCCGR